MPLVFYLAIASHNVCNKLVQGLIPLFYCQFFCLAAQYWHWNIAYNIYAGTAPSYFNMAENVPSVVIPPPPSSNPVEQALEWTGSVPEANQDSIIDEDGLDEF